MAAPTETFFHLKWICRSELFFDVDITCRTQGSRKERGREGKKGTIRAAVWMCWKRFRCLLGVLTGDTGCWCNVGGGWVGKVSPSPLPPHTPYLHRGVRFSGELKRWETLDVERREAPAGLKNGRRWDLATVSLKVNVSDLNLKIGNIKKWDLVSEKKGGATFTAGTPAAKHLLTFLVKSQVKALLALMRWIHKSWALILFYSYYAEVKGQRRSTMTGAEKRQNQSGKTSFMGATVKVKGRKKKSRRCIARFCASTPFHAKCSFLQKKVNILWCLQIKWWNDVIY